MNTPCSSAAERAHAPDGPPPVADEWCRIHRLIDELSSVQVRLGTPLEQPDDYRRVRGLGSHLRERLDGLRPWVEGG